MYRISFINPQFNPINFGGGGQICLRFFRAQIFFSKQFFFWLTIIFFDLKNFLKKKKLNFFERFGSKKCFLARNLTSGRHIIKNRVFGFQALLQPFFSLFWRFFASPADTTDAKKRQNRVKNQNFQKTVTYVKDWLELRPQPKF